MVPSLLSGLPSFKKKKITIEAHLSAFQIIEIPRKLLVFKVSIHPLSSSTTQQDCIQEMCRQTKCSSIQTTQSYTVSEMMTKPVQHSTNSQDATGCACQSAQSVQESQNKIISEDGYFFPLHQQMSDSCAYCADGSTRREENSSPHDGTSCHDVKLIARTLLR